MNELLLKDNVIMVVGAGRPPAPEMIMALADQGAVLAVNDLSPVLLDPLVKAVQARGGRIKAYVADATRGMPLRSMIDEILEDWGQINVLINNPRIQPNAPLIAMDEWDWQRTVEMNLNGPFLVTQIVSKLMQEQEQGVVLNIVDDNQPALEAPGLAAYAASQKGLLAFSQAAARELIAYNIRVHTLCPDQGIFNQANEADMDRPGSSLTDLGVYLCSPAAAHLNGQLFRVNQSQIKPPSGAL